MKRFGSRGHIIAKSFLPIIKGVFGFALRTGFDFRVEGGENIPAEGAAILASNHPTYLDPPFVYAASWIARKRPVYFMAAAYLFDLPILGPWLSEFGAYPVEEKTFTRMPYKQTLELLELGELVGLFLEGGRSKFSPLMNKKLKTGAVRASLTLDVPIIPMTILGGWRIWPSFLPWKLPRFKPARVIVHPPYKPPPQFPGESEKQHWHRCLEQLRTIIEQPIKDYFQMRYGTELRASGHSFTPPSA